MIQTSKIPELIDPQAMYSTNGQEAWRVLGIMAEFAVATERLRGVRPAVSMFGSARIKPDHPYYDKGRTHRAPVVRRGLLGDLRRRSGADGGRQSRRARGPVAGDRPQHPAAARAGGQRLPGCRDQLPLFLRAQDDVRALRVGVRRAAGRFRHDRRADRMPDAGADRQEPQDSDHPRRRRILARPASTGCATSSSAKA